ncbi:MAG: YebC/PmpR family DNA-binding transcriptional regulator [Alicyclobacillus herbarius]|uniref:YebC/PmpR family DNA-binding transcriptional regulator n=1 Tax=Alicyclobacillus herbarius TaxID=122960 RepID=UPI00041D425A|nr:YebC/PmpR family DNA-binding transcriptional regulator [Alicyclobacillus herbarius]MCL6632312.1 YebC/PmpR family DNA-binding transcriptional regulator [Alicyclobacillus herbarius]
MAGHSKWHNIQRRKGKQDAIRGQLFTKLSRDIYNAAKEGGGNPETNFRLRVAIEKAKQNNVPNDNIQRTIAKATGSMPGVHYEEAVYEGYGPHGVAVMLEIVTDNRNRTAADIRHIFSKRGGNLGETGCVAWMFERIGRISIEKAAGIELDDLILAALELGADDVREESDEFVVVTAPEVFTQVRDGLEAQKLPVQDAEITYEPKTTVPLSEDQAESVLDLLDALSEHDDVQNVYANLEVTETA